VLPKQPNAEMKTRLGLTLPQDTLTSPSISSWSGYGGGEMGLREGLSKQAGVKGPPPRRFRIDPHRAYPEIFSRWWHAALDRQFSVKGRRRAQARNRGSRENLLFDSFPCSSRLSHCSGLVRMSAWGVNASCLVVGMGAVACVVRVVAACLAFHDSCSQSATLLCLVALPWYPKLVCPTSTR
jgi:hypothetical protein